MKQTIYLMRHGQTRFNALKKVQGACDSPLTPLGIQQAQLARTYFQTNGIHFDAAYASTQERACDTLELITAQPYTRLKGLKEWDFGVFEGENERVMRLPLPTNDFPDDHLVLFGGETASAVRQRMRETLENICAQNHERILIVSHGASCFIAFHEWFIRDGQLHKLDNCTIIEITYENGTFTFVQRIDHDFTSLTV